LRKRLSFAADKLLAQALVSIALHVDATGMQSIPLAARNEHSPNRIKEATCVTLMLEADVDGLTWQAYAADLERNLTDLHAGSVPGRTRPTKASSSYLGCLTSKRSSGQG
jgi:hypothetical protein